MACRCQERRAALRRAMEAKSAAEIRKEAGFVVRTMGEDAARVFRHGKRKESQ